jgi:hypothetical protein
MRDEYSSLSSEVCIPELISLETIRGKMESLLKYVENPIQPEEEFLTMLEYCKEKGFIELYEFFERQYDSIFTKRILKVSDGRLI